MRRMSSDVLAAWLSALARSQPLVVLVDDLHRARAATLESLVRILEGTADAPILTVLAWDDDREPNDPAELERLAEHVRRQATDAAGNREVRLPPLTEDEVTALVTHHFHHATRDFGWAACCTSAVRATRVWWRSC